MYIDLLIGADLYYQFVNDVIIRGHENCPVAVESELGWLLSGPMKADSSTSSNLSSWHSLKCSESELGIIVHNDDLTLNEQVKKFRDTETIGIREIESTVYDDFLRTVKYDDSNQCYEVQLPWKPDRGFLLITIKMQPRD